MSYKDELFPWRIIRHLPKCQGIVVPRFRRRNQAEAHLQALRCLIPDARFTLMFDITVDDIVPAIAMTKHLSQPNHQ
ncbi:MULTISPECIES: hypothetical protein [Moorena]|nr:MULTISPECIES: hypothetical protein [Moorena]NEQ12546.1 hypothetical protein [Moorena sp. SIO3E2]NEP68420.1 hypothetical protein [Moorena sp. SIO3A5]NER91071.1 hypothetical protein [Moorena sp. SIO3A2]NES43757.1 hypothetical protein [Moorena sp. SIO2C4]OLT64536.1 hypothetical protein BI334_05415 [Moorena producens 3L]